MLQRFQINVFQHRCTLDRCYSNVSAIGNESLSVYVQYSIDCIDSVTGIGNFNRPYRDYARPGAIHT